MELYKIRVKTLENNIITFHSIPEYTTSNGFISFTDQKTGREKIFSTSMCEIEKEDKNARN